MKAIDLRKELGLTTKDVSIRIESCGYSQSISVKIKNLMLSDQGIENALKQHEEIRRCERTGETLEGANTYLFVEYDYDTLQAATTKLSASIEESFNSLRKELTDANILKIGKFNDEDLFASRRDDSILIRVKNSVGCSLVYDLSDYTRLLIVLNARGNLKTDLNIKKLLQSGTL